MPRRSVATPLYDNELNWVNVTVTCEECGDSIITIQIKELIEQQPEFTCPMCEQPTGQKTIVEPSA